MNIAELKDALELALERGLDPKTEVVVGGDMVNTDWATVSEAIDPAMPGVGEGLMWFTLLAYDSADARFTRGHCMWAE